MDGQAMEMAPEWFETVVVGGGQAGLAVGYHLRRRGRSFVILDAGERVGDPWRDRWDSLRLYTPARYSGLPGLGFPAAGWHYPAKDEVAGYLESYAARFQLPVRGGVRVDGLSFRDGRYLVTAGARRFEAGNVVVATGAFHHPRIPGFAAELDPGIRQLHSSGYRRPAQLREGGVLVARVRRRDLDAAGIERVPRTTGARGGLPLLEDGRALEVANVVFCTGFRHDFSWIDLPVFDTGDEPRQDRGVVASQPGLYFVGLHFLTSIVSPLVGGVGHDAEHVAARIAGAKPAKVAASA
jgi:putative flavoprotein involved in K+ transport